MYILQVIVFVYTVLIGIIYRKRKGRRRRKKKRRKNNIKIRNTILGKTRCRSVRGLLVVFFLLYVLFAVDVMFCFSVQGYGKCIETFILESQKVIPHNLYVLY